MSSLFQTMSLSTITLDEALQVLPLPRVVGAHPEDGKEIVAANGRYGPFVKWGDETRSLDSEEQLLTDHRRRGGQGPRRAEEVRSAPGGAGAAAQELGNDPVSGKPVVVKDGRFGPYVTDGETNASLRKGDTVENITIERAAELLQIRREAGPAKKARKGDQEGAGQEGAGQEGGGEEEGAGQEGRAAKATTQAAPVADA